MKTSHYYLACLAVLLIGILACHDGGNSTGGVIDDPLDPPDRKSTTVVICVPAADGSGDTFTTTVEESELDAWLADGATLGVCAGDDPGSGDDDDDDSDDSGDDDDDDDAA